MLTKPKSAIRLSFEVLQIREAVTYGPPDAVKAQLIRNTLQRTTALRFEMFTDPETKSRLFVRVA